MRAELHASAHKKEKSNGELSWKRYLNGSVKKGHSEKESYLPAALKQAKSRRSEKLKTTREEKRETSL